MSDPLGLLDDNDPLGLLSAPTSEANKIARKTGWRGQLQGDIEKMDRPNMNVGRDFIRPAMQMGGAALGATATAPIPGASVIGAGAGYIGGGKLYDIGESALGYGQPKTSGQVVGEIPKEFAEGAAGQVFNIGLEKFATAAKPYLSRMAEKTYASAAKMPLAKGWVQGRARPSGEMTDRALATQAALENKIPISEKGLEMAKQKELEYRAIVDNTIDSLTQQGTTSRRSDLLRGLDDVYRKAAVSGDPQGAAKTIDSVARKFMKGPETLTPNELSDIKRQMYKEASDYGKKFKSFHESAHKGIANEAMKTLESMEPSLARLNEKDAAYIKLTEALEKATGREANKYSIGLQDAVGLTGGAVGGALKGGDASSAGEGAAAGLIFTKVMRDPMVLSQLSFALNKASKMTPNPLLERVLSTALGKGSVGVLTPKEAQAAPPPTPQPQLVSQPTPAPTPKKRIDQATAEAIMEEAGGDPDKARQIAKERGLI